MPKKKNSSSPATAGARNTAGALSNPSPNIPGDLAAEKAKNTETLAAAVPHNPNKSGEFGRDNAVNPPTGFSVEPPSPDVAASTLTERNASDKTGGGDAPEGQTAMDGSLDNVRVDNTGRPLTTNQGVAIGDNQNSLKAGLLLDAAGRPAFSSRLRDAPSARIVLQCRY